ncbi:MAG: TIGR00300 family protein [Chloroflexi bacterium]|nr:TIGR00300 family protein [Chloroflexota bacterium]OJV91997.1 MAG: TIGR00300 family protein [Chloroflexi bacterium 54-19]
MYEQKIELRGHIVDSFILPQIMDAIMDLGGNYVFEQFDIGRTKDEPSYCLMRLSAASQDALDETLRLVQRLGATILEDRDCEFKPAPRDGVFPLDFYSTTNLQTFVRAQGEWIPVAKTEMDCGIILREKDGKSSAMCIPVTHIKKGELIAVGHTGIRLEPMERDRKREVFAFMGSSVSTERPKELAIAGLVNEMREAKARNRKILLVGGPAIAHTGAAKYLSKLIEMGYVDVLFAGNALATHDIETALYGTSLGISLNTGLNEEEGHQHHIRAINTIRYYGSIQSAVEAGVLKSGVMYTLVKKNIPFVLCGSIRDDGPLPEVITDVLEGQDAMRAHIGDVDIAIMISTMLHSIAVGNLLPARVRTVCVDINPSVVTKLADRGSHQTLGIVTDVESFLRELQHQLEEADKN